MYERLRIQLPNFFMTNHDYTMYSNDVEFINGIINVKISGRILYQLTLSLWRLLCLCYYAEARLDVLKLTKHMEDGTIKARWRIKGLPFYSLLMFGFRCLVVLFNPNVIFSRTFDALSTFYIGRDGLIHCHKVEKVMPAQPPVLPRVTSLLAGALVALGVEDHRPVLNLLPLLLSSLRQSRS
uniref:Si:ch211-215a10.4 n=1 Tax=Acanthochromis polyacanthus TaxID=80966 RepID=A0A3Q1FYL8_9TELE